MTSVSWRKRCESQEVGQDSSVWSRREKKSCCFLASGGNLSLLHWWNGMWITLVCMSQFKTLYPCCFITLKDWCVEEVQSVLTGTRPMFADHREGGGQSDRLPIPSQERSLLGLVISSAIYISNHFSCKLHASTLNRTKYRTINYKQIQVHYLLKDTTRLSMKHVCTSPSTEQVYTAVK